MQAPACIFMGFVMDRGGNGGIWAAMLSRKFLPLEVFEMNFQEQLRSGEFAYLFSPVMPIRKKKSLEMGMLGRLAELDQEYKIFDGDIQVVINNPDHRSDYAPGFGVKLRYVDSPDYFGVEQACRAGLSFMEQFGVDDNFGMFNFGTVVPKRSAASKAMRQAARVPLKPVKFFAPGADFGLVPC